MSSLVGPSNLYVTKVVAFLIKKTQKSGSATYQSQVPTTVSGMGHSRFTETVSGWEPTAIRESRRTPLSLIQISRVAPVQQLFQTRQLLALWGKRSHVEGNTRATVDKSLLLHSCLLVHCCCLKKGLSATRTFVSDSRSGKSGGWYSTIHWNNPKYQFLTRRKRRMRVIGRHSSALGWVSLCLVWD